MLEDLDKEMIDTCLTRPNSVWECIKKITIPKYETYLSELKPTCNTEMRRTEHKNITAHYNKCKNEIDYFQTDEFDEDLVAVLMAVAQRLHGCSTKFMSLKPYIENWHNCRTIDRKTALIISVAFGFNIDEARKLFFTVLDDSEQMDFNPRLPNEMIYAYAIIKSIPLTAKPMKIKGEEIQQVSVQNLLREAKQKYLTNLFGNSYSRYYDDLILISEDSFSLLDSLNMTRSAFSLAIVKFFREKKVSAENVGLILRILMRECVFSPKSAALLFPIIIEKNNFERNCINAILASLVTGGAITTAKVATLFASALDSKISSEEKELLFAPFKGKGKKEVVLTIEETKEYLLSLSENNTLSTEAVTELINELQESMSDCKENVTSKRMKALIPNSSLEQLFYEQYFYDTETFVPALKPKYDTTKKSKQLYLEMLRLSERYLTVAKDKAQSMDDEIYNTILRFVSQAKEFVDKKNINTVLSPVDFLSLLGNSEFAWTGDYSSAIKNILISKFNDEAKPRTENEDEDNEKDNVEIESDRPQKQKRKRTSSYHVTSLDQIISKEQGKYYVFFWKMIIESVNFLHAFTERKILFFWSVFEEMNRILFYPYFDGNGIAAKIWVREEKRELNDDYTYTMDMLEEWKVAAELMPHPEVYTKSLISDVHCYEYFNQVFISRGKIDFVKGIGKTALSSLGVTKKSQPSEWEVFYSFKKYTKQYYERSISFSRKDILKLAFWNFICQIEKDDDFDPELRKVDFTSYFDNKVAPSTCCAGFNESNSLDRFLLLCLEHEDPALFLKEVITYYQTLPKEQSKQFWKMLQ